MGKIKAAIDIINSDKLRGDDITIEIITQITDCYEYTLMSRIIKAAIDAMNNAVYEEKHFSLRFGCYKANKFFFTSLIKIPGKTRSQNRKPHSGRVSLSCCSVRFNVPEPITIQALSAQLFK